MNNNLYKTAFSVGSSEGRYKSSDVTQWHHAELKPAVSSDATNIFSFQVHMTGTAGATFEINDLSVVFRVKNVK